MTGSLRVLRALAGGAIAAVVAIVVAALVLPPMAYADNCGSLTDCYYTARAALAALVGLSVLFGVLISLTLDFLPGVGTVKGIIEAITGRDLVTGQELAWWERALGVVPVVGGLAGTAAAASRLGRAADAADLFSRGGKLSNLEVLERGVGLNRTMDTVHEYSRLAEVDFQGATVEILTELDDIRYLDFQGAVARTDDLGVQLGPAAFQDAETLVRTLGHESIHVDQIRQGRTIGTAELGQLEDEAYGAEQRFVDAWRRNSP